MNDSKWMRMKKVMQRMKELEQVGAGELIVLPEYSNAGGLSDPERERAALPRAKEMLKAADEVKK